MSRDYKSTVFLPKTDFPMRAGLPAKEPELLRRWAEMDLFHTLRADAAARPAYRLHDGPPYANGNIHIGHAVNKILKDVINRSWQMMGYNANYVPGWDCHGLPIEWKIEEKYRSAGQDKDAVPILQFRKECRDFAAHWMAVQTEEFQRLGVLGDWENPYSTMTFAAEARIVGEIHKFAVNGGLYKGAKPVMWSVVEKTALAEAEVEYHDHTSTTVSIAFPVIAPSRPELAGAKVVIWTTTPWTLPGNRAIAYGPEFAYALYRVDAVTESAAVTVGQTLVVAVDLAENLAKAAGITAWSEQARWSGEALAGTVCAHPLRGQGYDFPVRLLPGDFVTTETGTGFVHIAPGHGEDDFILGRQHGVEVPATVSEDGSYYPHVPLFAGKVVYTAHGKTGNANAAVLEAMRAAGALLAQDTVRHSYPHSWRSKAPLIFRTTPQWFIAMRTNRLREVALEAVAATRWIPPQGRNRIGAMIESRPDWCISRQRAWGVPIALFVHRQDGTVLTDPAVLERIQALFALEGSDAWFARDPADFLGAAYDPADWDQVRDIVDVWFESGSTHSFVLEDRPELGWPASLYLEGSDQHRGWFHSSLLESCGTRGRAPYDAVLTHGFVLDEQARKMSKSLGNVVAPQAVCDEYGADILRLWVMGCDYSEDMRIGKEILKYQADLYRRFRNTLRYLLGALDGWNPERETVAVETMPELERWVLHRLAEMDALVRRSIEAYDFHALFTALHNFCAVELSAFYFDIRKDSLYCDAATAPRRRAVRTVMAEIFSCLTAWLAPILCFTAEEAWLARPGGGGPGDSVHRRVFPALPPAWSNPELAERWGLIRDVRRVVTGALERERAAKRLGSSLQAAPAVWLETRHVEALAGLDLAEICLTSAIRVQVDAPPAEAFTLPDVAGVGVLPGLAEGHKCERCWQILPTVGQSAAHPGLCPRCAEAVG